MLAARGLGRGVCGCACAARRGEGVTGRHASRGIARARWVLSSQSPTADAGVSGSDRDVDERDEGGDEDLWSQRKHLHVTRGFLKPDLAKSLRGVFDERFDDPRRGHSDRFVWDYWHVPGQYTLVRTPAKSYFPEPMFAELEDSLLTYGQNQLGCSAITPIWLSYYVDGCFQGMHGDIPHGPWAFVLSLTDYERATFEGGETTLLKPEILEYWRTFDASRGLESGDVLESVPPHFNQLAVFDPRLPHGVSEVKGTRDPRTARVVLHGWFAEPRPFFEGALSAEQVEPRLEACLEEMNGELQTMPPAVGALSLRLHIDQAGEVRSLDWLTDTLVPVPGAPVLALDGACVEPPEDARALILEVIVENLAKLSFPVAEGETQITVPFLFE